MNSLDRLTFSRRFPGSMNRFLVEPSPGVVKPYRSDVRLVGQTPNVIIPPIVLAETGEASIQRSWPTVFASTQFVLDPFSMAIEGYSPAGIALPVKVAAQVGGLSVAGHTATVEATSIPLDSISTIWWFDEGSGTSVFDASGVGDGFTGTISSTGGAWTSEGYSLPDGNIIHANSLGASNHTVLVAFKFANPTTADSRWLWGWGVGGLRLGLHHSTGTLLYPYGLVRVNGANVTKVLSTRLIDVGEWVIVAASADAGGNMNLHLWADGTRYDDSIAIGSPIDATNTDFRLKGSADPAFTFGAVLHWKRSMAVSELEDVVASVKAVLTARGIAFA